MRGPLEVFTIPLNLSPSLVPMQATLRFYFAAMEKTPEFSPQLHGRQNLRVAWERGYHAPTFDSLQPNCAAS